MMKARHCRTCKGLFEPPRSRPRTTMCRPCYLAAAKRTQPRRYAAMMRFKKNITDAKLTGHADGSVTLWMVYQLERETP